MHQFMRRPSDAHGGTRLVIGRRSSAAAEQISADLRLGRSDHLAHRRSIVRYGLVAAAAMGGVLAYQTGVVRRLPEPSLPFLDAERVDASGEAYELLKTPDAALGLVSYAVTIALAAAGGRHRAQQRPWLPLALAAKVGVDIVGGVYLTIEQASKHRKFCSWCLAATLASIAMAPHAGSEALTAGRRLLGRS